MKQAWKTTGPDCLLHEAAKANGRDTWKYFNGRSEVRSQLEAEQAGLCCYCGRAFRTQGASRIDHFAPRESFPARCYSYDNLYASCFCPPKSRTEDEDTCDAFKAAKFDPTLALRPDTPDVEDRFNYTALGEIEPADPNDAAALHMIELVNLNEARLCAAREELFDALSDPREFPIAELEPLIDICTQHLKSTKATTLTNVKRRMMINLLSGQLI